METEKPLGLEYMLLAGSAQAEAPRPVQKQHHSHILGAGVIGGDWATAAEAL